MGREALSRRILMSSKCRISGKKACPQSLQERAPKAYFDEKRDAWMFGSPEVPVQAVGGCSWLVAAGEVRAYRRAGFSLARPGVGTPSSE